ncbi:TPA: type VI secretion system tube protein TssD [Citrobacter freundii]|uniref:Type VI secretion system tube protein Hcp n=1 Tax=Citrobacter freundii TaxID=546 RepID=A0AAI9HEU0_CITFR|nr:MULTISPECIES: type VI secretion system tube protein TssD [Citrobacter]EKV7198820.1 type VI secretion system tube protein Hcp [Citrobacter freundii]EKW4401912.1 type VI secretion system tube protein Hcp [Citrobacter freundii]EKX8776475.1 type VI secretion system tube protein Hcp [Citrobacter freundii]ELF4150337.1 type VI secretion system tube protein Hcp [Citrobacter freundii]ELI8780371.1 type VI secretion system tube protein Hcp [Citrobacter freundii]
MSDLVYLRITGERQGDISSGCGAYESVGNRWQVGHEDEISVFTLVNTLTGTGNGLNLQGLNFCKLIDKSSPLFCNAITQNERLYIEIDLYRINKTGRWERYYYIQLRNALVANIYTNFTHNNLDTESITVTYEYIVCKHLIANTEFDYLAFPAEYNTMFIPRRNAPAHKPTPAPVPIANPVPPPPEVMPVYAKSCLKEKGCTDAGTAQEPAENFGQMAIFAQLAVDDCCGYRHQPDERSAAHPPVEGAAAPLLLASQVWGEWSLGGVLGAARGMPYIGALASALYIPSAGEGSARVPGRDEFWYEEVLRQKALAGSTATTRVRFFWRDDIHGKPQVYGVHTGEGTPYENVRVANMLWNDHTQRYEFTPAHDIDGPLITWTPEKPATGNLPGHTGNNRPPVDQPTILVTPIPDGKNEYTTPTFPLPAVEDFNDYILVFPADSGIKPIYVYLKDDPRKQSGVVTGKGGELSPGTRWLDMSVTNQGSGAPIPAHIADKLRGLEFKNFDDFREALWLEVSKDPDLMEQFIKSNQNNVSQGYTPYVPEEGYYYGPNEIVKKFQIHHVVAIGQGGEVYDIDNLRIVTPRLHDEIHYRR